MSLKAKINRKRLLSIFLLFLVNWLAAQQISKAYFFEGDEVVFEFDSRDYAKAYKAGTEEQLDFADLKIHEVIVSGKFNGWASDNWTMKKISRYKYQLRKKIWEFNDPFKWEFKFLVNGQYEARPLNAEPNAKIHSNDFLEDTYNLKLDNIKPAINGNTLFSLKGFLQAGKVILAGSFNGWNEDYLRMSRTDEGWELRINLPPGNYEYKFIADGNWLHDPANPRKIRNEHGTFNSILTIQQLVTFRLKGFPNAKQVILAGSFNDWNEKKTQLSQQDGQWAITLELPVGKHLYKFIVDGNWMVDPANPLHEQDRKGYVNSVLLVR
ncbi:MAG: glycogen-binding domain-containing protein [Saprospiraceae bacterium]